MTADVRLVPLEQRMARQLRAFVAVWLTAIAGLCLAPPIPPWSFRLLTGRCI